MDVDRSEAFHEQVIGLRKLYRFGDLSFFDCAGVRLFLDKAREPAKFSPQGCIYFRCADVALTVTQLERRGVVFTLGPGLTAHMDDHVYGWHSSRIPMGIRWQSCRKRPRATRLQRSPSFKQQGDVGGAVARKRTKCYSPIVTEA